MQLAHFSDRDEGKDVVNAAGEILGRVVNVEDSALYVAPVPTVTDTVLPEDGWDDADGNRHPLPAASVEGITPDAIRLRGLRP